MRQSGEDGGARLAAQPLHHGSQVEALVVRACLEIGELPQNDCLLIVQHASMQQLGEHAFDAVGVFRDVFQKKYALFDGGEIRGTQQAGEYAQIATPQSGILHRFFQQCRAGFWLFFFADDPASAFAASLHHLGKTGLGDFVRFCDLPPIINQQITCPCNGWLCGRLCKQGRLQGGEVAQPDKLCAIFNGLDDFFPRQLRKNAGKSVASAR